MRFRFVTAGLLVSALSCGGSADPGGTPPTSVVSVGQIQISPASLTVDLGGSATVSATVLDTKGSVLSGKTVTWSSSNTAVVSVDATSGVVRGLALGSGLITATVDGKTGSVGVVVAAPAVASVTVGAPSTSIVAGQSVSLSAILKDKTGAVLTGRGVAWSSSAVRIAAVDASGVVTTFSAGTAVLTAASEGITGSLSLVVSAPAGAVAPTIASVLPSTLTVGATATIAGANFIPTPASNLVFISGVRATVTSATSSQLSVVVPAIPCQSTQAVNIDVSTVGGTATTRQTLAIATQRSLAVGQSFLAASGTDRGCNELPTNGTYLVTVFNATQALGLSSGFELSGAAGGAVASSSSATSYPLLPAPAAALAQSGLDPEKAAAARAHLQDLMEQREFLRVNGPPSRYWRAAHRATSNSVQGGGQSASIAAKPLPVVGSTVAFNFNRNGCRQPASQKISARVVYVGPRAIVLEDNAAPVAGKVDADLITVAKDWENLGYPVLSNFGNVFAYDDQLGGNGHITMMFTPRVNAVGQIAGFVGYCDFYPSSETNYFSSNETEVFYAFVPTDTLSNSSAGTGRASWKSQLPGILVHETKHILAGAERNATPIETGFEEVWLEEATAQLASEMYARVLHGNTWKSDAAYSVLFCENRSTVASCNGGAAVMLLHYEYLEDFLVNIESKTILSGTDDGDIYGSSWLFARWLVDTYGGNDESAFLKKLILNFTQYGVDNVKNASGKTWPELLSQFTLMLAADNLDAAKSPFQEASWNLPDIWLGYHKDYPSYFPSVPLTPRKANFASAFTTGPLTLKGGGAIILRIDGGTAQAPQLLDLHSTGGTALAAGSSVGIAVLRIQ